MIWQDRDTICGLIDSKTFKEEAVAYENHLVEKITIIICFILS
jgi:hypothetical protein